MQTFLPYPDFQRSAECLDRARLGKQRVEVKQILNALLGPSSGWKSHPAVKMWFKYHVALAVYGMAICAEWEKRGYQDTLYDEFEQFVHHEVMGGADIIYPPWIGNENFHRSHRANLVRKMPKHYVPLFGELPPEPYVWPIK